jgi:hypothetical protein
MNSRTGGMQMEMFLLLQGIFFTTAIYDHRSKINPHFPGLFLYFALSKRLVTTGSLLKKAFSFAKTKMA